MAPAQPAPPGRRPRRPEWALPTPPAPVPTAWLPLPCSSSCMYEATMSYLRAGQDRERRLRDHESMLGAHQYQEHGPGPAAGFARVEETAARSQRSGMRQAMTSAVTTAGEPRIAVR